MELVKQDGNDSLDMLIRRAVGKDPFLSFSRPEHSPVQLFQLLHNLERPGWPLLSPLKIQLHKCEKCTREFCSPVNHRRHSRIHRRSRKTEKDCGKERDALGAFWDKLSVVDAKEILSLKSMMLEDVTGESVESGLMSLIEKPGYTTLPQYYLRAGSDLLDMMIQARTYRFPISSQELFRILDDASEKTFLCNEAARMQKYIFDGENGKKVLEANNVVACASFLLEQRLIKAWLADKDAEAMRCQNLLVEEEEATQRRQAELLERKKRKKLRQKEQRVKDQKKDVKEAESTTSEEQHSPAESSSPLSVASDSEAQRSDSIVEDSSSLEEPQVLEMDTGRNCETQAPMVDDDGLGNGQYMERRSGRRQMEKRSQHGISNGFHGNHAPKLGGIRKKGANRDVRGNTTKVWTRKANNPKSISPDVAVNEQDQTKNSEVLIGSVSVTIGNRCLSGGHNHITCSEEERRTVEAKPTSEPSTVKVWRPVSSQGKIDENTDKKDKNSSSTAPEVKTAHHIGLQFNNHEAKAFLAKRWKEATSAEHVTLVLSQETDMSGDNNTHESSSGVITAARPKLWKKPEKSTKVKYIPKQRIP